MATATPPPSSPPTASAGSRRVLRNSKSCCFAGDQHEGEPAYPDIELPSNSQRKVFGYLSWPREPHIQHDKGLLLVPDANGLWHNFRLLADQFAAAGYMTLVVPYNGVVRAGDKPASQASPDTTLGLADDAAKNAAYMSVMYMGHSVLTGHGCTKIGIVAYSDGVKAVLDLIKKTSPIKFTACFLATPTLEADRLNLDHVETPISIALADEYDANCDNDEAQHMAIENQLKISGVPYQISIYSHVHVGFAQIRRIHSKAQVFAKKQAFIQAITFMQEHMLNGQ